MFGKILRSVSIGFAAAFVGYCIYFDRQRLRDPDYKKKRHMRRLRESQKKTVNMNRPNSLDPSDIERYFVDQINLGETCIKNGLFESGVEHLARAVLICRQPDRLMPVLQVSLSQGVFALLVHKLQDLRRLQTGENYMRNGLATPPPFNPNPREGLTNIIDDLE